MISNISANPTALAAENRFSSQLATAQPLNDKKTQESQAKLRDAFNDFVGQTFYGQMLSAMRSTVGKPASFHGGHAEEVFQSQLDQVLAEKMADATAEQFTGPMFKLFTLARR